MTTQMKLLANPFLFRTFILIAKSLGAEDKPLSNQYNCRAEGVTSNNIAFAS